MIKSNLKSIILVASIVVVALISLLIMELTKVEGSCVEIVVDGVVVGKYSINDDIVKEIKIGEDQYNVVIIKDQKAYIQDASCPDYICVNHKAISFVGQTITCKPNKVVVVITGESDIDIVV